MIWVLSIWLISGPIVFIVNDLEIGKGFGEVCDEDPHHRLYYLGIWISVIFTFTLHEILSLVGVILISIKIIAAAFQRNKISERGLNGDEKRYTKEIRITLVMLFIAILNVIIFLPMSILETIFHLLVLPPIETEQLSDMELIKIIEFREIITKFHQFFKETIILAHVGNFFIYYTRIPSFKKVFFQWLCCKESSGK